MPEYQNTGPVHVLTADQVAMLAHGLRREVLTTINALRRATAAEVGMELGRPASSVTYHIKKLLDAGLVVEVERRPTGHKPESVYSTVSTRFILPNPEPGTAERERQTRSVVKNLRAHLRQFERAANMTGSRPDVMRASLRLSEGHLKEFLKILASATKYAAEHHDPSQPPFDWAGVGFYRPKPTSRP